MSEASASIFGFFYSSKSILIKYYLLMLCLVIEEYLIRLLIDE